MLMTRIIFAKHECHLLGLVILNEGEKEIEHTWFFSLDWIIDIIKLYKFTNFFVAENDKRMSNLFSK